MIMYLCHTEQFKPSFHDTVSVVEIGGGWGGGGWEELRKRGGEEKGTAERVEKFIWRRGR